MIVQSHLSELFSNNTLPEKINGTTRVREVGQVFDSFSAILSQTGKETAGTTGNKSDYTGWQDAAESRAIRNKINTYRQTARSTTRNIRQTTGNPRTCTPGVNTEDEGEKPRKAEQQDQTLALAAQVLGMNSDDLRKLLDTFGISPQEISDVQGAQDTASRLADVLNLGDTARETLTLLFKATAEAVRGAGTGAIVRMDTSLQAEVSVPVDTGTVSGEEEKGQTLSDLLTPEAARITDQMKSAAEKLTLRRLEEPDAFTRYLAEKLTGSGDGISTAEAAGTALQNLNEATIQGHSEENADLSAQKAEKLQKSEASSDAENTGEQKNGTASESSQFQAQAKDTGEAPSAVNTENAIPTTAQAMQNTAQAEKTGKTQAVSVSAHEVLKQVVEKARVVLSGDKSEMIMDLKPDNLGKLSLKVVTEHGMVMAKFIAENQQVKEVLETNMQILKDALEKQGMQIQEFSVSVGQQSAGQFHDSYGTPREKGYGPVNSTAGGVRQEGAAEALSAAKANAYGWTGSTLNYTA